DLVTLDVFQPRLKAELKETLARIGKRDWSDALACWVAQHYLHLSSNDADQACLMQGAGEEGIDFFWVEHGRKRVIIGQAEASKELDLRKKLGRGIVDKARRALSALNDLEIAADHR